MAPATTTFLPTLLSIATNGIYLWRMFYTLMDPVQYLKKLLECLFVWSFFYLNRLMRNVSAIRYRACSSVLSHRQFWIDYVDYTSRLYATKWEVNKSPAGIIGCARLDVQHLFVFGTPESNTNKQPASLGTSCTALLHCVRTIQSRLRLYLCARKWYF